MSGTTNVIDSKSRLYEDLILFPVHKWCLLELQEDIPQPGPVLLVVVHLGVEVTVPAHSLPLCPRLQTIHVCKECFFSYTVFLLGLLQLFLVVFIPR